MTWGDGRLRWVRPLQRILCVFDRQIVPVNIDGIVAADLSEGHRFMGEPGPFRARDFDEYREALAGHFVVLDAEERKARIQSGAEAHCRAQDLDLVEDEGLLDEVAGLAEWPVPLLGAMDPTFLQLPPEVIRTSMRTHQRYFAVRNRSGALAPRFVVVANIETADGGALVAAGNARVLSARLKDAQFFWDEDRRAGFDGWLEKLKGVTFHAKLGTMAERVARIEQLAESLAPTRRRRPQAGRARRRTTPRPTSPPAWLASFPSCRASWAPTTPARRGSPDPSPRRSASSTGRRGRATKSRTRRSRWRWRWPTSWTRWPASSRSARNRPARATPTPCAVRRWA